MACRCCAKSASVICASGSPRPNCPAARPSASSSRPNCSASRAETICTCSTSRRRACMRSDVEKLIVQLDRLVAAGNTVVAIEHEMRRRRRQRLDHRHRAGSGENGGAWWRRVHPNRSQRAVWRAASVSISHGIWPQQTSAHRRPCPTASDMQFRARLSHHDMLSSLRLCRRGCHVPSLFPIFCCSPVWQQRRSASPPGMSIWRGPAPIPTRRR